MDAKGESFGILNAAYGIGRAALLEWVNELLELQCTQIEQCATGAIHCQIMDCIFPGSFPSFKKVKWQAKHAYEFVENYKILQDAFKKNGITKVIDVQRLQLARYQDNLEFVQWMKGYFENKYSGQPYDAVERRGGPKVQLHYILPGNKLQAGGAPKAKPVAPRVIKSTTSDIASKYAAAQRPATASKAPEAKISSTVKAVGGKAAAVDKQQVDTLKAQLAEMQENNQVLEKEREFYFGKLQLIEEALKLNGLEDQAVGAGVLNIMYAGEEDQVNLNEATGDIEIIAEGDHEAKIYSLKEEVVLQAAAVQQPDTVDDAAKDLTDDMNLLDVGDDAQMKD